MGHYPAKDDTSEASWRTAMAPGGRLPNADILLGHMTASLCHLGNIATRLQRSLQFDQKKGRDRRRRRSIAVGGTKIPPALGCPCIGVLPRLVLRPQLSAFRRGGRRELALKEWKRVAPTLVRKKLRHREGVIRTRVGVACDKRLDPDVNGLCLLCLRTPTIVRIMPTR